MAENEEIREPREEDASPADMLLSGPEEAGKKKKEKKPRKIKEPKEPKAPREPKEPKAPKEPRAQKARTPREPKEPGTSWLSGMFKKQPKAAPDAGAVPPEDAAPDADAAPPEAGPAVPAPVPDGPPPPLPDTGKKKKEKKPKKIKEPKAAKPKKKAPPKKKPAKKAPPKEKPPKKPKPKKEPKLKENLDGQEAQEAQEAPESPAPGKPEKKSKKKENAVADDKKTNLPADEAVAVPHKGRSLRVALLTSLGWIALIFICMLVVKYDPTPDQSIQANILLFLANDEDHQNVIDLYYESDILGLAEQQRELDRRDEELDAREEELDDMESALDEREGELEDREDRVEDILSQFTGPEGDVSLSASEQAQILAKTLVAMQPAQAARTLEELDIDKAVYLCSLIKKDKKLGPIFDQMDPDVRVEIAELMAGDPPEPPDLED